MQKKYAHIFCSLVHTFVIRVQHFGLETLEYGVFFTCYTQNIHVSKKSLFNMVAILTTYIKHV
jgi:hypothetical protein